MSRRLQIGALATAAFVLAGCGGSDGTGGMVPVPDVTLLDVQTTVLTPRCALSGCHVAGSAPFGLDMSSVNVSRANLVNVASGEVPALMRVQPGDADSSYMYLKLIDDPSIQGDPMPALGEPLSPADLALVRTWIDGGAQ